MVPRRRTSANGSAVSCPSPTRWRSTRSFARSLTAVDRPVLTEAGRRCEWGHDRRRILTHDIDPLEVRDTQEPTRDGDIRHLRWVHAHDVDAGCVDGDRIVPDHEEPDVL